MLQRQILLKQLQELQRRQQLQEPGDARNQDYINQLLSLKQSSGNQFPPIVNRATVNDSQMMQHSGSDILQGSLNGLVLSQSHNYALGSMALSMPQCDISLYGNTASNLHSPLQGPDNHSANLLAMNSDNASGMYPAPALGTDSSFMSHPGNYYSEQIGLPSESFLTNQVFQDKNLFGQVPIHSLNRDLLLMDYSQQGIPLQRSTLILESGERYGGTGSYGTPGQVSNVSQRNDSLDPLEQKVLNNSEYNSWASSFGSKKIDTPSFESTVENPSYMVTSPSVQSGSWSALMQSAVAETSSSDTAMQEEWSGLSFQNPELSSENQPLNFINSEIPQNNWIDRNMQNVPSPCSNPDPLFQKSYDNYSLQSGFQIFKQKDEFQSETSNVPNQYSLRNTSNLVQTSLTSPSIWPAKCHESGGPTWIQGNTSDSVIGHTQKSFNQVNQMNGQKYSVESETMDFGTIVGHSEIMLELPNKNEVSNDHTSGIELNSTVSFNDLLPTDTSAEYFTKPHDSSTVSQGFGFKLMPAYAGAPQSNSFFPSLSMGSSHLSSVPSDYVNYVRMQHQALPVSSQLTTKFPEYSSPYSQVNHFQQKGTGTGALEFPIVDGIVDAQSSGPSYVLQSASFPMGLSTPLPDNITCGDVLSRKPFNFSYNLLRCPGAVSCTLQNSSGASPVQPSLIYPKSEHNVQAFGTYSGTSGSCEPQVDKRSSIPESSHMSIPASVNRIARTISRNPSEADGFVAGVLMTCASQRPTKQSEHKDNEEPGFLPVGTKPVGQFLNQNLHSRRHFEVECSKRTLKYDNINHQQPIASAGELSIEQKLLLKDKEEYDEQGVQLLASPKGSGILQEAQDNQLRKLEAAPPQDFRLMEKLSQSVIQARSIGNKEASNLENQPQISLQMAPSWFKHYGTNKDLLLPKSATNSAQPFSGLNIADVQGHSLVMQLNQANINQGSDSRSSSPAALIMNNNLPDAADVTDQTSAVIKLKKRKLVAFDMVPWHKEVNCDGPKLQSVSEAELEWSQVSNRRQELTKSYAETIGDVPRVVQSKRRLTSTTQLMQQVFRPAPACILSTDASSNYNIFVYSTARLELGDACNLTSKLAASSNDLLFDKLKTSKRNVCNFSKVAEGLTSRVKKLKGDLTRLDRSLSVVDIKVESQDLEKFSTINCFAKFHIKAHPGIVDATSSSGQSAQQKAIPRSCVMGFPMPRTLPEVADCLSL